MADKELWTAVAVTGISICVGVAWWHRDWSARMQDMQDQVNDLRLDLIHRNPPMATDAQHEQGTMRRVK
jgi:hypothetical protein